MSETEKPLHIRVAEALGCKPEPFVSVGRGMDLTTPDAWACHCPGSNKGKAHGSILGVYRYDIDWAATGPLVEKYLFELSLRSGPNWPTWEAATALTAQDEAGEGTIVEGSTPLIAICNLILALHAAGKL